MVKMHSLKSIDGSLCPKKHFWEAKNFDLFFQSECTVGGNFNNKSHINQVSKVLVSESVTSPGNEQTRKSNEMMMMSDYFDNVLRCGGL